MKGYIRYYYWWMKENTGYATGIRDKENSWKYNTLLLECGFREQSIPQEAQ